MECNKEEAFRAMQLAEKKMQDNEFPGALKIAKRAQRLFPDLENISQLLTVCEVHCSAETKLGKTEMDWYRILQVEQLADADGVTIKKQYRKLALLLHPDKNKFAGAEAAFKLIGEAYRMLSDEKTRSSYDMKYRMLTRTAPKASVPQSNGNSSVHSYSGATNNSQKFSHQQYPGWPSFQPAQGPQQQTFWTLCPYCNIRYQYFKTCLEKMLLCANCQKHFIAHDLGIQGGPSGFAWNQFPDQKEAPVQEPSKIPSQYNVRNTSGKNYPNMFANPQPKSKAGKATKHRGDPKMEAKDNGKVQRSKQGVLMPDIGSGKSHKPESSKNVNKKRRRQSADESSESFNTETDGLQDNFVDSSRSRRSARHKQGVSYKENISDDDNDFVSPPKRSRVSKSSSASEADKKKAFATDGPTKGDSSDPYGNFKDGYKNNVGQSASVPHEESVPSKKVTTGEYDVKGKEAGMSDHHNQMSKSDDELKSNEASPPESLSYPDPDFNDFDKDRAENCFSVNQMWAIYDPADGLPRFYARIKKVFSSGFKLKITWLEADPDEADEIAWCDAELPVGCGKYTIGSTQDTVDCPMFSHQMHCIKQSGRNTFLVHPRKGETWALFRNWDIKWSSEPIQPGLMKFDYVEVLSDFVEDVGVGVAYLARVEGFVSLFQQAKQHGVVTFNIPPNELYRFSHQIPSFKMTGDEREDVPKGSYELDPAALPSYFFELNDRDDEKVDNGSMKTETNGLSANSKVRESVQTEKKDLDSKRETLLPRKSPRRSNNNGQTDASQQIAVDVGAKDMNCNPSMESAPCSANETFNTPKKQQINHEIEGFRLRRSPRELTKKKSEVFTDEVVSIKHPDSDKKNNDSFTESNLKTASSSCAGKEHGKENSSRSAVSTPSISPSPKSSQAEGFDFNQLKSEGKFQLNQIWALRFDQDPFPKTYALVKRIESTPKFQLHVAMLEPCVQPKSTIQPESCGIFKVKNDKTKVFSLSSFSYCSGAKPIGGDRYEIYPRKGEVWAVYRNLGKADCDIVEVLQDYDQCTEVAILLPVSGFKSVFRAPRIQRSKAGVLKIPRSEAARFSHQIAAIRRSGDTDKQLAGCWELDPLSVPGNIIILD